MIYIAMIMTMSRRLAGRETVDGRHISDLSAQARTRPGGPQRYEAA
jgi:hypothetical protein